MSRPLTLFVIRNAKTGEYLTDPENGLDEGPFHKAFIFRSPHHAAAMIEAVEEEAQNELEASDNFFGIRAKIEFEYQLLSFNLNDPGDETEEIEEENTDEQSE